MKESYDSFVFVMSCCSLKSGSCDSLGLLLNFKINHKNLCEYFFTHVMTKMLTFVMTAERTTLISDARERI